MKKHIAAAVLAGGQSRRMGQPKALLQLGGRSLLERLINALESEVSTVVVAGCPQADLYSHLSAPVIEDRYRDGGPLAGIHSVLSYFSSSHQAGEGGGISAVLFLPCDGVELPANFVSRMCRALETAGPETELVYGRDRQREQYLYCLLRCQLHVSLDEYIKDGGRKVIDWMESRRYAVVDFSANDFEFSNLNTADDYQQYID